jgi:protein-S-isoprenylcysteine O-methyltransferase Ste14
MSRRAVPKLAAMFAVASLTVAAVSSPTLARGVLCLLPCLLLALLLVWDRYLGEELILRAARRRRPARARARRSAPPRKTAAERPLAGRLVVAATGPRAPPIPGGA